MKHLRYVRTAAFVLLIAAYVGLRYRDLTASCLWFDEIFSVHAAEHSWNTLFSFVALDLIHPPLFYVLLKLWIGVGGESLAWLRMFPFLLSIISIVPLILFLRELERNVRTQLICLFLLTVNGSLLKYSLEVRMYSMLMCLSLFSLWLFARYFVKGKSFIPLIIVNILLVHTHYFGWFVVLSEAVAIITLQRIKWRRILMMFGIVFVSFVPWIIALWQAASSGSELGQNIGWMSRPGAREIVTFVLNLVEPFYHQASTADPISIFKVSLPIILIIAIAICLYCADTMERSDDEKQIFKLLILFVALPLIIAFVISWTLPYSIWGTRHLIIVFAPVSILTAAALTRIPIPSIKIGAITLILLFSGYAFVLESSRTPPRYSWCAWEPLAEAAAAKPDANIYTFEDLVAYHLWFADRNRLDSQTKVIKVRNLEGVNEDKAYFLPRGFKEVATVSLDEINETRLWVAYRGKFIDVTNPPLSAFIVKGYHLADQKLISVDQENAMIVLLEK
ncbi:MAG: hypothetical protein ABJB40_01940 [Acidobacteriota bacterium]